MSEIHLNQSVGEIVAQSLGRSKVFERLGIDFCCGGSRTLADACREKGVQADSVVEELLCCDEAATESEAELDSATSSLAELCDHIEQTHHAYLRTELPHLTEIVNKVVEVHGEKHPRLHELRLVFAALRAELEPHMMKEEQILFPAIRQLEATSGRSDFPFGSVANPIRMMEHEHDNAGGGLGRLRILTEDFQSPEDACNTYRAMLAGLEQLELDLHQHIHKENNILFPRAMQLECERASE